MLLLAIYVGVQVASAFHVMGAGADLNAVMAGCELLGGAVGILFIVALGGTAIAKPGMRGMKTAWKAAAWLFFIDGLLVLMDLLSVAYGHDTLEIAHDWPIRVFVVALLCLGVGMFEETLMRGLCLNGLLARFGGSRKGMYGAVIASAIFFGFLHFDFFIDFGDPLQVAQNFMKVVQTGIVGYLLAAILVYTRNLWAPILIHAANDFLLMFMTYGLKNQTLDTTYVQTGDDGVTTLVVYIVLSLFYAPLVYFGSKMLNRVGSWRGDFYHYDDPPKPDSLWNPGVPIRFTGVTPTAAPTGTIPIASPHPMPRQAIPVAQRGANPPSHPAPPPTPQAYVQAHEPNAPYSPQPQSPEGTSHGQDLRPQ